MIDSHCHLPMPGGKEDWRAIQQRAAEAGVTSLVTVGTNPEDWPVYRDYAASSRGSVAWTAGIHPGSVEGMPSDALGQLENLLANPPEPAPVALGEIGLDRTYLPRDCEAAEAAWTRQVATYRAQVRLAARRGLPIIIHSRGTADECLDELLQAGFPPGRAVFHCFTAPPETARRLVEAGAWISVTGIVTFKSGGDVREAVRLCALERFMIETDSPYLSPEPHRGTRNEPARLPLVARACAEVLGLPEEAVATRTTTNTREFFGLKP